MARAGEYVTLREHLEALRAADRETAAERDRRYAEVAEARAEALKIKETADRDALGLAREIQQYKDEKANNLRSQIEGERGNYPTKEDLKAAIEKLEETIKPLAQYVAAQQGRSSGYSSSWQVLVSAMVLVGAVVAIVVKM